VTSLVGKILNKAPVAYAPGGRGGRSPLALPRLAGAEQQMRAMGSVSTVFSIVNRTSNATAAVEWKLYRKAKSGNKADRVEVTSHAALDLWNKPNPYMPRQEFVESGQQHIDLTGEGWLVVYRVPGIDIPLELWPVRPDRMQPVPDAENFLAGYIYTGPDGERVPLELNQVIQLRMPNPLDPYRGMGPVQTLLSDLDATRYSAEWNRNFFLNSAEPGGIIEVEDRLDDVEFDEMRDRWNEQHRGVANAHRVAILERGKWVDRKFSQRDMQFVELRNVGREIIREAFGISGFELGLVDDVNRATAEASAALFAEQLTVPRLERWKAALNNDLLPMFGKGTADLEFDYISPVPADRAADDRERQSKAKAARDLIEAGGYFPEVLEALGLPAIAFGQPNADPKRELLIDLVKGAPTLAPLILPMLGYELPATPVPGGTE
jgi:HK97 family phage portal protein